MKLYFGNAVATTTILMILALLDFIGWSVWGDVYKRQVLKLAKGYWGSKSKHFKMANQAVMKSLTYAYTGRKLKKRDFRSLWITRISAACKMNGMNYSTFMHGLKVAGIEINRKMLSELAISDPAAFTQLIEIAKKA